MKTSAATFAIVHDGNDELCLEVQERGDVLLRAPLTNKGTAFTTKERIELGLEGLLPPRVESLDQQVARVYAAYGLETTSLGRYRFLRRVQDTNEVLFYALLDRHVHEMLPIIYTPTVGEGVERFSDVWEEPRGLSLTIGDDVEASIENASVNDVRMIVATDSSAILGIGDQGYNGLAISIGKLSLYTVGGGVSPFRTMPVVLDVGTDRAALSDAPNYLGTQRKRLRGDDHLAFVRAFVDGVKARWPRAIVQWEDFGKETAFEVLDAFREEIPSFNDDIQGTGAVALAGLLVATRLKNKKLADERFLVFGAGAGGIGVARAIRDGLEREGLSRADAHAHIFVVDSKGLLVAGRGGMEGYKHEFAQPVDAIRAWKVIEGAYPSLRETITHAKITSLLGLSGQPSTFNEEVIRAVTLNSDQPIVFALSNPTTSCEAIPADVLGWSLGKAIVATGSPFEPVNYNGQEHEIGQGNNAFVFPGLGFGAILTEARKITDGMVAEAAYALADFTMSRHAEKNFVYPPVEDLRAASVCVAARVALRAIADGVATTKQNLPTTASAMEAHVTRLAWTPRYLPFRLQQSVGSTT